MGTGVGHRERCTTFNNCGGAGDNVTQPRGDGPLSKITRIDPRDRGDLGNRGCFATLPACRKGGHDEMAPYARAVALNDLRMAGKAADCCPDADFFREFPKRRGFEGFAKLHMATGKAPDLSHGRMLP